MLITYFVHGTTTDNELDLASGWADVDLSETGVKQAYALGQQARDVRFDVVFCSDLKRAIDSATFAFGEKSEIIQDSRLREADYGDFTQKPSKDFKNSLNNYISSPFPNGESYLDVENRIKIFLDYLRTDYSGKSIAIVAHQAPQLALEVLTKGKSWEQAFKEDWRHTKSWQPGWEYTLD